jgi:hypothetical protein
MTDLEKTTARENPFMECEELLAGVTENLWTAVLCGSPSDHQREIYEKMKSPRPGDWVLEISNRRPPAKERMGKLIKQYSHACYLVEMANGLINWENAEFIRILTRGKTND